jgi:hypothetical protein
VKTITRQEYIIGENENGARIIEELPSAEVPELLTRGLVKYVDEVSAWAWNELETMGRTVLKWAFFLPPRDGQTTELEQEHHREWKVTGTQRLKTQMMVR